ncbi:hypothetical protein E0K89_022135 [Aquicoccus sp. SCR17]|nr:hypothetical protein [Carideicomes alvinocaridis]
MAETRQHFFRISIPQQSILISFLFPNGVRLRKTPAFPVALRNSLLFLNGFNDQQASVSIDRISKLLLDDLVSGAMSFHAGFVFLVTHLPRAVRRRLGGAGA